ncbi:hypothetical protein AVDCRST_MAG94-6385, partial [uncultured Leptolyngbya sp.]
AGVASEGYCFYKAANGIERHLAADTLGLSLLYSLHASV